MPRTVTERADALPALAEAFRDYGFDGASIALISKATGLGKGSLYHFFPGGKNEMLAAVLDEIEGWFEREVFTPLEQAREAPVAVAAMFEAVMRYFRSGARVCLVGVMGMAASRDPFGKPIAAYFARWIEALAHCLAGHGVARDRAVILSEEAVAGIQGAIVLARALDDTDAFARVVAQHRNRLLGALQESGTTA